jgi:hypothetical protein
LTALAVACTSRTQSPRRYSTRSVGISHNPGMRRLPSQSPSPALAELLAKTGELDRILDGRGLEFT